MTQALLETNHYSLEIINEVNEICASFFKQYNMRHFCYFRYFNEGSVYVCISHRDLYLHHLNREYPVTPTINERYTNKKFHYFAMQELNDGFDQVVFDYQSFFGIKNPIYLFEKYADYSDVFVFSANQSDSINYFSNNIHILENFKFYFKDKAAALIKNSDRNRIKLPEHMRPNLDLNELQLPSIEENQFIPSKYLLDLPNVHLTNREVEIIRYIENGYTSKETAQMIHLSHRTIEAHWQNIKNKLGCEKKHEIIAMTKKLGITK